MCDLEFGHTLLTGQETSLQRKEQHTCTQVSISLYAAVFFSSFSHKHGIAENRFVFTTYALSGQLYENVAIRRHIFANLVRSRSFSVQPSLVFSFPTVVSLGSYTLMGSCSRIPWSLSLDRKVSLPCLVGPGMKLSW